MTRVVADSNVLVSALQFGGKPMALLTLAEEGQIDLAISEAILTETLGVLRVKFQNTEEQLADREAYLRVISRMVTPSEAVAVIQAEPADDSIPVLLQFELARITTQGPSSLLTSIIPFQAINQSLNECNVNSQRETGILSYPQ